MKKLLLAFVLINSILFAKINDSLSLFTEEQKVSIDTIINKMQKNYGLEIYVNTYSGEEGFITDKNQKAILLNLIKINDDKVKVELKFTKDMELDENTKNAIENLLGENEKAIEEKNNALYVEEMLVGIDALLENIKEEDPIIIEAENRGISKKNIFIGLGLAILVIFGIIVVVFRTKNKKTDED